jgi:putative membrane protein insertion efficiency factor
MRRLMAWPILGVITLYQYLLSPLLGVNCRFHPSCSHYAREAIEKHGACKGGWLAIKRLARCHPWGGSGDDPVP